MSIYDKIYETAFEDELQKIAKVVEELPVEQARRLMAEDRALGLGYKTDLDSVKDKNLKGGKYPMVGAGAGAGIGALAMGAAVSKKFAPIAKRYMFPAKIKRLMALGAGLGGAGAGLGLGYNVGGKLQQGTPHDKAVQELKKAYNSKRQDLLKKHNVEDDVMYADWGSF